jgi:zinc/manganese transport system substrate-binding protein
MITRRQVLFAASAAVLLGSSPVTAQSKIKVVATFSILGDLVKNVGGDRVEIMTLVGPDGDAHAFSPSPADAKMLAAAKLVVVNGLGFEGWIARLVNASGTKASTVVASKGIASRKMEDEDHPGKTQIDPHAWQSIANTRVYVANIRDGLSKADPAGKDIYAANAKAYLAKLIVLEREVRAAVNKIPADRRKIITSHDAFGYFGAAYRVEFIAPEGVSTESAASAKDVARIIAQIRQQKIPAVFLENVSDPRLMQQIARETGARIGGRLYSDALSGPGGSAGSYIDMMRHNVRTLSAALMS